MRVLGRLMFSVALMVPVGVAVANSSGAVVHNTASCAGTTGSIDSNLKNNGVGDNGGLLLATKGPQQFKLLARGQSCTGGTVTHARVAAQVTTATAVNCQTIRVNASATPPQSGVVLGGSGTFTWTAPDGMGSSNFNVQWLWTSDTTIHFSGSVSAGGSTNNVFGGDHVSGNITTSTSLKSVASGGNCTATIPLSHFNITKISYNLS